MLVLSNPVQISHSKIVPAYCRKGPRRQTKSENWTDTDKYWGENNDNECDVDFHWSTLRCSIVDIDANWNKCSNNTVNCESYQLQDNACSLTLSSMYANLSYLAAVQSKPAANPITIPPKDGAPFVRWSTWGIRLPSRLSSSWKGDCQ